MAINMDSDQTAPWEKSCQGSNRGFKVFASMIRSMVCSALEYMQQV